VTEFNRGELMSTVVMSFEGNTITSAITTRSFDMLGIMKGNQVEALVKSNEISLKAV
jgi:molybdopterin-binding protein